MKAKPIINDSNFSKVPPKQTLFIVRPKPSQTKLQVPSHSRQLSSSTSSCPTQKSIDECVACLQLQISQQTVMPKVFSLRVREHLLTLKLKLNLEQQSYNQNRKSADLSQTLAKKHSSKFRGQRNEGYEESRNKENSLSTESLLTLKMVKGKSTRNELQIQIQTLKAKLNSMSDRIEKYQRQYQHAKIQIKKLESQHQKEIHEKIEWKEQLLQQQQKKNDLECQLRKLLSQLEKRCGLMEHQKRVLLECLSQRESQIITFYQLLPKRND